MDHARRREELGRRMRNRGLDAFLVINVERSDRPNLRYLTGFTGSFGILIAGERSLFATDSRYTEQAGREIAGLPVEEVKGRWLPWLAERLKALGVTKVGIGAQRTSLHVYQELTRLASGIEFVPQTGLVEELRRVKSEEEIARISSAARLTDEGLRWIVGRLAPGQKERDVALDLEVWYRRHGAEGVAFDLIVAGGPGSAMPHHRPTDRAIARGDVVLFDIGGQVNGYCADLTRVVAVGDPGGEVREVYRTVLEANRAGLAAVRAGRTGKDVDQAARDVIARAGHGDRFGHGLGHGVGLEVHEAPTVGPSSDDALEVGTVVTIEPGIYLPGRFGIRIEDLVAVTADGCRILSSSPKDELLVV
ncbi:MAG: Xaa-Pro peptidase family protein [Candidatus Bipolaricaulis anaerobius]|nr:Xaa-Pro peptidase family protein [Candidatus Bipolaricaulis anaerobius]